MNPKLLISLMLLLMAWNLEAQKTKSKSDEPSKNIDSYLDDGMARNSNNLIRLRLSTSLSGYIGASYEYKFSKRLGIEGGMYTKIGNKGVIEHERLILSSTTLNNFDEHYKIRGGAGILIYPKYYYSGKYLNNVYYFGIRTTFHSYKTETNYLSDQNGSPKVNTQKIRSTFSSYAMTYGIHRNIAGNFTLGTEWGLIFYIDKFKDVKYGYEDFSSSTYKVIASDETSIGISPFADISLGYLF